MKKCPKCNKVMSNSSAFCDMCGTSLEDVKETEELLDTVAPIPKIKPKEAEETEILEETETLEPEEYKKNLEERGKSFFEPEPEIEQAFYASQEKVMPYEENPMPYEEKEEKKEANKDDEKESETEPEKEKEPETVPETKPEKKKKTSTKKKKTKQQKKKVKAPSIDVPIEPDLVPKTAEPVEEAKGTIKEKIQVKKSSVTKRSSTSTPTEPETTPTTAPKTEELKEEKEEEIKEEKEEKTEAPTVPETTAKTEAPTEPVTEPETEAPTEAPTEPAVLVATEPVTEPQTQAPVTAAAVPIVPPPLVQTQPVTFPMPQPITQPVTQPAVMQTVPTPQPQVVPTPIAATQQIPVQPVVETSQVQFTETPLTPEEDKKLMLSMVLGIVSLILCVMWPVAIVGLVIACLVKTTNKKRIYAIVLNAFTITIGLIAMFIFIGKINNKTTPDPVEEKKETFYGEGYTLKYDSSWKATTLDNNRGLLYSDKKSYFVTLGQSNLDVTIDCDFSKISCKSSTYEEFYSFWSKEVDKNKYLFTRDSSFANLKDDIYYATYNYSLAETGELKGKYYIVISVKKNSAISFYSSADEVDLVNLNPEIVELLKTIDMDEQSSSTATPPEDVSNWNLYSSIRGDAAARKKTIYGEYRILSDDSSYWVFKNGEFWWYKSEDNLNDNYWYGTINVKTGKSGMKSVGLSESRLDSILDAHDGKVTASDVYSITLVPKKIISKGEDKSATNIPKGTKWKFVWVLIDHNNEGIEAEVLNVDTADTSYFVKVKD